MDYTFTVIPRLHDTTGCQSGYGRPMD